MKLKKFSTGLEKANNITARLRVENPKRHIGYTISILRKEGENLY